LAGSAAGDSAGTGGSAGADGRHFESRLDNEVGGAALPPPVHASPPLQRIADVPVNWTDPLVRRAPSLQLTADARPPAAYARGTTLDALGIADGDRVRVTQAGGEATLTARRDDRVADGVVRIATAHPDTAGLPSYFGAIAVERLA